MAESAVSFLLEQLAVVLRDERNLLGGLKQEVQSINDELVFLKEFLRTADEKEETDSNIKEWVSQLREISFDVQDVLDEYMLRFGRYHGPTRLSGLLKRFRDSIKNLKSRHQIASEIKSISCRLKNVVKIQQTYKDMYAAIDLGSSSTNPTTEEFDGRGDALFLEEDDVVGIEEPKEQLLKWIWLTDSGVDVIAVVGMGGLGKTTLVKKVYEDESIKTYFDVHVWVVVSDYRDVKHLLQNLIKKLTGKFKEPPPQGLLDDMSIDDMRDFIYEFLKKKKYIFVLDDVWKSATWEALRYALPKKEGHGCIIMTTRSKSISQAACSETNHVYNLEPLSEKKSLALFLKRAFPGKQCPPYLREFGISILKKCGGMPLAIVLIGGLLATKKNQAKEWELLYRSLGHELEVGSLKRLSKVISLSYNDLPYYLKYCFLYLSIFPEGGLLEKERVIRLWTAEGFVQLGHNQIVEETAEGYLNELCNRNLVQVAKETIDGRGREFRIHDIVREYVISISREHNIVTIYKGAGEQLSNKIRRLAIQNFSNFFLEANNFKHMRSLLVLSDESKDIDFIKDLVSRSRILKVLDLRGAPIEIIPNGVSKLYHLKHLCLRNTLIKIIPTWIKDLRDLETLDLKNTSVAELPVEILKLQKLRHLLLYKYKYGSAYKTPFDFIHSFRAPYDIGIHLRSLQKLCCIDADEVGNVRIVKEIGKLIQLKKLTLAKLRSKDGKDLCSSIGKLTSLQSLEIYAIEEGEKLDLDHPLSSTSLPFLRYLHLWGCLQKLPQWIPFLHGLAELYLRHCKLREDPLSFLQDLPNLVELRIQDAYVEGLRFKAHGFQKLKELCLMELRWMKWVVVERGSMPSLQTWEICDCELLSELPQGIEHLTNLKRIDFDDMPKEYMEMVVEEKRRQGASWRLAHVPDVYSFTMADDRSWSYTRL